jgi:hypothetical protein
MTNTKWWQKLTLPLARWTKKRSQLDLYHSPGYIQQTRNCSSDNKCFFYYLLSNDFFFDKQLCNFSKRFVNIVNYTRQSNWISNVKELELWVLNVTFTNISVISSWSVLSWEETGKFQEKNTDLKQVIDKLYHIESCIKYIL